MGRARKARVTAQGLNNLASAWETFRSASRPEPDVPVLSASTEAVLDSVVGRLDSGDIARVSAEAAQRDTARGIDRVNVLSAEIQERCKGLIEDISLWAQLKSGKDFPLKRRQEMICGHFAGDEKFKLNSLLPKLSDRGRGRFMAEAKLIRALKAEDIALYYSLPDAESPKQTAGDTEAHDLASKESPTVQVETTALVPVVRAVDEIVVSATEKDVKRRATRRDRVIAASAGTVSGPSGVIHELSGHLAGTKTLDVEPVEVDLTPEAVEASFELISAGILRAEKIFVRLDEQAPDGFKSDDDFVHARARMSEALELLKSAEAKIYEDFKAKKLTKIEKERLIASVRDGRRRRQSWLDRLRRLSADSLERHTTDSQIEDFSDENITSLEDDFTAEEPVTDEQARPPKPSKVPAAIPARDAGITLVPALEAKPRQATEVLAKQAGFLQRASQSWNNALDYIRHGWRRVYTEEVLGELAPHELAGSVEVGRSEARLQAMAGIAGGLASSLGVAFIPDVTRWATQTLAAKADREAMTEAITRAVRTRSELYRSQGATADSDKRYFANRLEEHRNRQQVLLEKVQANRRLTSEQKNLLLEKLQVVLVNFEVEGAKIENTYELEVDYSLSAGLKDAEQSAQEFVGAYFVSKVSGGKVLREAVNTAAVFGSGVAIASGAATVFAGLHLMRGPAYSFQAVVERYSRAKQEHARGQRNQEVTVTNVVKEGFSEWWTKLSGGQRSYRDLGQALGTLVRSLGLGGVSLTAGGELLSEAMAKADLDEVLDVGLNSIKTAGRELYASWFGEAAPAALSAEFERSVFKGEIPVGSRVLGSNNHEGITYILKRVIQNNPEAYGYSGEGDLSAELFAKRLAVQIADNDGQMRRWLTDKAIDKLNLFPEFINGEWHMAAVVDGKKLSMDELAARGFTSTAPASSK